VQGPNQLTLTGNTSKAHDPSIWKEGDTYYVFTTGNLNDAKGLVAMRTSSDLIYRTLNGAVFAALPEWTSTEVPGTGGIWAPDIYKHTGEFRLYYSISRFGENHSAIGLARTDVLRPAGTGSGWTERGLVMQSSQSDNCNAIDPALLIDADRRHWMSFGSFWSGIKMVELDSASAMRRASNSTLHSLAARSSPGVVEAPEIIRRGEYYDLFVSSDFCCRGSDSTYSTVIGRSRWPTGPYVDAEGQPMLEGGGTQVLTSGQDENSRFVNPAHISILQDARQVCIVYRAYDASRWSFNSAGSPPKLDHRRLAGR
jgi:arabinan endo-1,5-alpha-L-arabinosidase